MDAAGQRVSARWSPSSNRWVDYLHFVGPGFFVAIAYVDPGNFQADIQAGATTQYRLLWTIWWTSILSIYVQVLCARLGVVAQATLAEVQAANTPRLLRYFNWFVAEFSAVITDLPEVIGMGIAFNVFFGWPYYVGVLISPITTMAFLATQRRGMRFMEAAIVFFVGIMSITLWIEQSEVGTDAPAYFEGWAYGFIKTENSDLFAITGIIGAVVMPHNLYLHTASVQSRPVVRTKDIVDRAVWYTTIEPIFPIVVSFFINAAIVAIAAERIYDPENPLAGNDAGLTDFSDNLNVNGANALWGLALLAAGQSSAVTTTYSGQYIMDGFLDVRLPLWARAVTTRLVAIIPCVAVAASFDHNDESDRRALNCMVNIVNAALSVLLPFALTPLVKYCTSVSYMGEYAAGRLERAVLWTGAFAVYATNAYALSAVGGGFFGDLIMGEQTVEKTQLGIIMDVTQVVYFAWNAYTAFAPVKKPMRAIGDARMVENENFGVVDMNNKEPLLGDI